MNKLEIKQAISEKINQVYCDKADAVMAELEPVIQKFEQLSFPKHEVIRENNVYLITYGDSIQSEGKAPLLALKETLDKVARETISDVHLLPMFPYTSDDGFSVTDYYQINSSLGDWSDIHHLGQDYRLMFDFVANHMSKSSDWFKKFLAEDSDFQEAFINENPNFDVSNVVRPRTSPLFHTYEGKNGPVSAWSTFSEDQVDVNIQDGKMLARLTDVILTYAREGASSIRLDAIGFLWKKSGTSSMHLTETHEVIQLWRILLEYFAPNTQIITETNVPHEENISYFGNKQNEAQMVYQFPLPPLVLHAFTKNSSKILNGWAKNIDRVSSTATYFNFLASHDGIGMRPTEGILPEEERGFLVEKVLANGGKVSYKSNLDGSKTVYELNINYSEALRNVGENDEQTTQKMIAAHHILLSMVGVPAIYYHSLFGSKNDFKGVSESGIHRRINREKLDKESLLSELETNHYRKTIFNGISKLIKTRKNYEQFSPYASQSVLDYGEKIFALKRILGDGQKSILAFTNVSNETVSIEGVRGFDIINEVPITDALSLNAYGFAWIEVDEK